MFPPASRPLLRSLPGLALAGVFLLHVTLPPPCAEAAADREGLALFETHIRPTLLSECIECHGPEKQKGGLRLDSRPGWQKGGESGPVLVPGKPAESLLLRSIQHLEPELKMPEKRPKLEEATIAHFSRWIELGAPDPRDQPPTGDARNLPWPELLAARRNWWSLQQLRPVSVPSTGSPEGHPVDAFLSAAMRREAVEPSAPAAPEALARRLHFILTGLPPAPAEVRAFVEAEAKVGRKAAVRARAGELASSQAFAEHWARHWMDLVRYAESHGSEGDPLLPNAYRYRDYLIRAFSADVPLDQMILEHVAGDLLPNPRISAEGISESRIGPAHLRMVEHGYKPVDTLDENMKVLDNQIDVVFKAFQALTLNCARCHDHKFDAVSQRDYTAVRGVFGSIRPAQIVAQTPELSGKARKPEFRVLKQNVREALCNLWEKEASEIPSKLRARAQPVVPAGLETLRARLADVEQRIGGLVWKELSLSGKQPPIVPYALWNFEDGPQDLLGRVAGELVGEAQVRDGALQLNGKTAYLRTAPLSVPLRERTLEAWVAPANLEQRGGGVLGIERMKGHGFDSLVFAEKTPRKWIAGSENFRRTLQPEGPDESSGSDTPVHLAIVYRADSTIQLFRNGVPYGAPYQKDKFQEYGAGDARVLIGLRHVGAHAGFFEGRVEEARLYDRALVETEVAASYAAGPTRFGPERAGTAQNGQSPELAALRAEAAQLSAELARESTKHDKETVSRKPFAEEHPLFASQRAATASASADFTRFLTDYVARMQTRIRENREWNAQQFSDAWDLGGADAPRWFGEGPDVEKTQCGEFRVRLRGDAALDALLPAGWSGSQLLPHAGGILTSPEFTLQSRALSVRMTSRNGALLRLVPDNYPLGNGGSLFPSANVQSAVPQWTRMNVAYRLGSSVYLECTTPEHFTLGMNGPPKNTPAEEAAEGPSFLVEKVVFHKDGDAKDPRPEHEALGLLLKNIAATDPQGHLKQFVEEVRLAVRAWRGGTLDEARRDLLQACIESGLLPTHHEASHALADAVAAYRKAAATLPKPTMVPGVVEHEGRPAALLARGDHKKPGDPVPRGFLEVLGAGPFEGGQSGRSELAARLVDPHNPLTARVMANRLWHWTFGMGIVPSVDDFGRMGEKPSHPELLDFIAARLQSGGWSARNFVLWLVETEAFQRSASPSASARERDPANALLSHASVRRLEAEEIRDALLQVSGELKTDAFGPPVDENTPRRSVYVRHRRGVLAPLFSVFDAPRPFTTLGRRSVTTVPAQSLLMLNDPSVRKLATVWAQRVEGKQSPPAANIEALFESAFGRRCTVQEREGALALAQESGLAGVAHALFNAKEFIYLR